MSMPPIPATYANRYHITVHPDGTVKLAFGEAVDGGGGDALHVAVLLTHENAEGLARLIDNVLAQHRAKPDISVAGDNVTPIR